MVSQPSAGCPEFVLMAMAGFQENVGLLRPRLITGTQSLLPHSIGQSKSQPILDLKCREIDAIFDGRR